MRVDKLMETGDMDGRAVWLRIVKALFAGEPREGRHGLYELSKRVLALVKQVLNEQADRGD